MNFDSFLSDIITGILSAALTWLLAYVLGFKKINKKIDVLEQTMLETQSSITTTLLESYINEKNRIVSDLETNMERQNELEQDRNNGIYGGNEEDNETYRILQKECQDKEKELENKLDIIHKRLVEILQILQL